MEEGSQWLAMEDGTDIYVRTWTTENQQPRAIVQLAHGMAEHIDRYRHFAHYLLQQGVFVYGNDHRGHGQTGKRMGQFGFFAEENGFERVVDDLYVINRKIQQQHFNIPIFLFGHSMGSFLVRRYIQKYPDSIRGVIISGTAGSPGIAGKVGKLLAKREIRKKGANALSPTLDRLSFGAFNKKIPQPMTKFDWLSRDEKAVGKYIADPFCGFVCTSGFFYDLFIGLETIHDSDLIKQIPKDLPMLVVSGEEDPVGGYLKGVRRSIRQYRKLGLRKIDEHYFQGARHELLQETNKEDVFQLILKWITNQS